MPAARSGPKVAKLTSKLRDDLCEKLKQGQTIEGATGLVGIHRSTFYDWLERGHAARAFREQGKAVPRNELAYLHFVDAVELARNHGEGWLHEKALEAIANPKEGGRWQGYVTLLERTRPDRWRRRASSEYAPKVADAPPSVFTFDPQKLSNDELRQLEVLLEKAQPREE